MFQGCPSVCACVRARTEAISYRLAVDFKLSFVVPLLCLVLVPHAR